MGNREFARVTSDTPQVFVYMELFFKDKHLDFFEVDKDELYFRNIQGKTHEELLRISKENPKAHITGHFNYESNQYSVGYELGYYNGEYYLKDIQLIYEIHYPDELVQLDDDTQADIINGVQSFYKSVDDVSVHPEGSYSIDDNSDKEIDVKMAIDGYTVHASKTGRTIDIVSVSKSET